MAVSSFAQESYNFDLKDFVFGDPVKHVHRNALHPIVGLEGFDRSSNAMGDDHQSAVSIDRD
jgi:hypothetical protein